MGYPQGPYGPDPYGQDPYGQQPAYQYGYVEYPQQPVYYPPPPPPRRSRAPLYTVLAVVGVLVIVLAVTIPLLLSREEEKPPPTASPSEMIVDEDDYSELDNFISDEGSGSDDFDATTKPRACDFLSTFQRPDDVDFARATWNDGEDTGIPFATVLVENWADDHLPDQAEVVENDCQTFSFTNGSEDGDVEVQAEVFTVEGADASTTGTVFDFEYSDGTTSTSRWYETIVRETTVRVGVGYEGSWSDADGEAAIELLNKQIALVREAE